MQLHVIYIHYTSGRNTICAQYLYSLYLFLLVVLFSVHIKAISSEWKQSSTPIELAGQSMSLLSFPKQRSSSSHVGVDDEAPEKLYIGVMIMLTQMHQL